MRFQGLSCSAQRRSKSTPVGIYLNKARDFVKKDKREVDDIKKGYKADVHEAVIIPNKCYLAYQIPTPV